MKKIPSLFIVILVCISITLNAQQQENLTFEIIHNNKPIGELKAVKEIKDGKTTYTDNTSIVAHIFTKIEVNYKYKCVFSNNKLLQADVVIKLNGHVRTKTSTTKTNSSYNFIKDDDKAVKVNEPINYSTVQLLFEEPAGISKVYGEEQGNFHKLKKTGEHTYLKTTLEGHKNTYYYKDGNLQKAEVHAGVISFTMQRK